MTTRSLLPGALLALALVAAGCGAEAGTGDSGGGGDTAPAPAPAAPPRTTLELTIWPEGEGAGDAMEYTLTCDPPGGTHPDPEAACAALRELGVEAFAPTPPDVACTQQYGGPMQAHVRGTVDGQELDARLAYTDGCEIARWDAVAVVVPRPDGALR